MAEKIQQDRGSVPALDSLMKQTADARLDQLAEALVGGFDSRGRRAQRQRALIRLALNIWTWRTLNREGLDDDTAAITRQTIRPRSHDRHTHDCLQRRQ